MKEILILTGGFIIIACSSQPEGENKVLAKANKIHLESELIQAQIEPEMEQIDSLKNLLRAKKTNKADSLVKNLTKLKNDFEDWEKNFFPVPDFEQTHEEHDHRHHSHAPPPELPADKMLEVQHEIKANIEGIQKALNKTLVEIKTVL